MRIRNLITLLLLFTVTFSSTASSLLRFPAANVTLEHLDPTLPPALTAKTPPKCSILVLHHVFANTAGEPPAVSNYVHPTECPFPWPRVVLELSIAASDVQKDRIAAVWLDGAELLRTATPLPMAPGTFWTVQKDVTRYAALFRRLCGVGATTTGVVSMMLENSNATLPGAFAANVTLHFYRGPLSGQRFGYMIHPTAKDIYRRPADIILPVSQDNGECTTGFWFRLQNDTQIPTAPIAIPRNTQRAVLEIFASYHAHDETWYANPLRSAYTAAAPSPTDGGFRQIYATIDGQFVGGHIPFPVIYPSSVNPYFWSPVAAIGAFNLPTYDLDLTPFLSILLDGQPHEIGLGVRDSQPYWLLAGNVHLWVDEWSDVVSAGVVEIRAPPLKVNRHAEWRNSDGGSEINAEGLVRFSGWVSSSEGNMTTTVRQKVKFRSQVEVQNRGAVAQVEMTNKERTSTAVLRNAQQTISRVQVFVEAPLQLQISRIKAMGGAIFEKARLSHQLQEVVNLNENGQAVGIGVLTDRQDAEGSMLKGEGQSQPVWGSGSTRSSYKYRDGNSCYLRTLTAAEGMVKADLTSASCASVGMAEA
ncbi:LOW QUALITY PROTEIN: peptide-N4-(N-acetyl-beta-glucosaminyl)asparagine amidase A-like [Phalaenopsis equestris]|uniref:LOW QUALITY PROTEIN: peptide-N4-(N-acetyl-beta-glucosaminyl)asparagine amidase A-like n=1 Tax=Phalaenopsis equestris TaxID=78828 RepID=UPI0009E21933|nr:LOW QUALITY PROTEIN: peptide-N4-(N-acetyl-beta-glucosaminyl)asparagine amidase A-like [Phalaenopsis equestris]